MCVGEGVVCVPEDEGKGEGGWVCVCGGGGRVCVGGRVQEGQTKVADDGKGVVL